MANQKPHRNRSDRNAVKAAIWENKAGDRAPATTSPSRSATATSEGQWKTTHSYGRNDLLVLAKVADRAHSRIFELQRTEDESEQAV